MKRKHSPTANKHFLNRLKPMVRLALFLLPASLMSAEVNFTTLHTFGGLDGAMPLAGLLPASDGYLYGTTVRGGANGIGAVFQISTNGDFSSLHSFGGPDGGFPLAGLIQGPGGFLYGTTVYGGAHTNADGLGDGTVYQITTQGAFTNVNSFTGSYASPWGGLVQAADGSLLGATVYGGDFNAGSLFSSDPAAKIFGPVLAFSGSSPGGIFGQHPTSMLVLDGCYYGTTEGDGLSVGQDGIFAGDGTVFSFVPPGIGGPAGSDLYFFGSVTDASGNPLDGSGPNGLLAGRDGVLYGTTFAGGTNGAGTVFALSTNGVLTRLYSFTGANDGANPGAALVQGGNGTLYGTTFAGGSSGNGAVFAINPDGTGFATLYNFSPVSTNSLGIYTNSDGANPMAKLIILGRTLYGTTSAGGNSGNGTVFSLNLPGPQLTISLTGTNVLLSWPANIPGYTLEYATNLAPPTVWTTNAVAPSIINGQNITTNSVTGTAMFFRLSD